MSVLKQSAPEKCLNVIFDSEFKVTVSWQVASQ